MAKSFNSHRVTTKPEAKKKKKGRGRHSAATNAIYRKKTLADGLMLSREYNADQNVRGYFQEQASAAARLGAEVGLHGSQAFRGRMPLSRSKGAHDDRPWQAMGRYGQTDPFQRHQREVMNRFREQTVNARQGVPPVARAGRMGGGRAAAGGRRAAAMADPLPPPRNANAGRPVYSRYNISSILNPIPPRLSPIIIEVSSPHRPFLPAAGAGAGLPRALPARSSSDSSASTAPFGDTPRTPMSPPTPPIVRRSIPTLGDVSVPTGVATPQDQMIPTQAVSAQNYNRGRMGRRGTYQGSLLARDAVRLRYANKGNTRRKINYLGSPATREKGKGGSSSGSGSSGKGKGAGRRK